MLAPRPARCCRATVFLAALCLAAVCFFSRLPVGCAAGNSPGRAPSLEVMAGQMIMAGFRGTGEEPLHEDLAFLLEDISKGRVGGVILFDRDALTKDTARNIVSVKQARRLTDMLQRRASIPLFVGVDQEGGRVRRFKEEHGVPATPSPRVMGEGTEAGAERAAFTLGHALRQAGINVDFAPSLDVDVNPQSPAIGALDRSFSADERKVAAYGGAFARGLLRAGIVPCYKHFPGHGSAAADTHLGAADITGTWQERELAPYKALLKPASPVMVMVGHVAHAGMDARFPASLSPSVINGLLRKKLGWNGVVITDDLQMEAVTGRHTAKETLLLAVTAGADILLLGNNLRHDPEDARKTHALLMELVREGKISRSRILASYKRIMALKVRMEYLRKKAE